MEAVSGQKLNDYFQQHILAPLGLHNTTFLPSAEHDARQAFMHYRSAEDGSFKEGPRYIAGAFSPPSPLSFPRRSPSFPPFPRLKEGERKHLA